MMTKRQYQGLNIGGLLLAMMLLAGCSIDDVQPKGGYQSTNAQRNVPYPLPSPRLKPNQIKSTGPTAAEVVVKRGDTLYSISRLTHVSIPELIQANGLSAPYTVRVGEKLIIPRANIHTVKRGETLSSVARSYGVSINALAKTNNLRSPYRLLVGDQLTIPGRFVARKSTPSKKKTPQALPSKKASAPKRNPQKRNTGYIPKRTGAKFMWPVRGKILSSFGDKGKGVRNDGIDIAAKTGQEVRAADAGRVAYVDNNFGHWGQLILIKHTGGWVSTYAHSSKILVSIGQQVKRGEVIALAGSSGSATNPRVHFELRKNKRIINPVQQMD